MATLTNIETQYTITQVSQIALDALYAEMGAELIEFALTPIPLWPFLAAGFAIADIISLFGGGKPVSVDTNNVIRAYNMSAYAPLHLLAADLTEMLRNGAPISDSRSQIQAQFGQLKQGTVTSLQALAGAQQGANGDGYWQFFNLIELTWQYASSYTTVLDIVKAIDQFVIGLTQLEQQNQVQPTPTPGPGPGGTFPAVWPWPVPMPCNPAIDPNADELGQGFACLAENGATLAYIGWLIYQLLKPTAAPPQEVPPPGSTAPSPDQACCDEIVSALGGIATATTAAGEAVAKALSPAAPTPAVDLSAIDTDLKNLIAVLQGGGGTAAAQIKRLADANDAADALAKAAIEYWGSLGLGDPSVAQLVSSAP
jgi:hypothetical protein